MVVKTNPNEAELRVDIKPAGPDASLIDRIQRALPVHEGLRAFAAQRTRLLDVQLVHQDDKADEAGKTPTRFRAVVYDYANARSLILEGDADAPERATVTPSAYQPLPNPEEFAEAVAILGRHDKLGPALREQQLRTYSPMPPLIPSNLPDGRSERIIAVGLLPRDGQAGQHEIAGVNMNSGEVVRFPNRAPDNARAIDQTCGQPDSGQPYISNTPGQVWITVTQGNTVLWRFLAVRPAASSGTNGSGVELRFVDYKGKRVLYRAHVPMLNVKYKDDKCGPYRDWQNWESAIQANGADVAPGFRLANTPATTILDTGSDTGNFTGVAIYVKGQEVVLVSEMQAGWYRYVSEWRLHTNGTIRPRFGFSAVTSSCVCNIHYHHVYWRLDFDLRTPGNNQVLEFNDPPIIGNSNWHEKKFEIKRFRDPGHHRRWRVTNTSSGETYDIVPGPNDNSALTMPDWPYGRGDVWVLRYHPNEIDDGSVAIGPPFEAGLDAWVNGESVEKQDVVIWYGAHFTHDIKNEPPGSFGEVVGPDLVLVKW